MKSFAECASVKKNYRIGLEEITITRFTFGAGSLTWHLFDILKNDIKDKMKLHAESPEI